MSNQTHLHNPPAAPDGDGRTRAVNEYFGQAAGDYDLKSEQGTWGWLKNAEYSAVSGLLGSIEGLDVLDAGCGAGWYARRLSTQKPRTYVALDTLFAMASKARGIDGVFPMAADSLRLPFKTSFDAVLCAGAMEFMDSPGEFFSEAARTLRPGGKLVLMAPGLGLMGKGYRWWHRRHGFEIHLFSRDGLAAMGEKAGLRLAEVRSAGLFNIAARLEKP